MELTMANSDQYLAIVGVMFLDGIFGMIAGTKREGFQTRKALSVLKNTAAWLVILTVILMVEQGFTGTAWLSEVIVVPFMVFQLISALKNASMAGFIKTTLLNEILDKIDKHKGIRDDKSKK
jgi:phage-related holin